MHQPSANIFQGAERYEDFQEGGMNSKLIQSRVDVRLESVDAALWSRKAGPLCQATNRRTAPHLPNFFCCTSEECGMLWNEYISGKKPPRPTSLAESTSMDSSRRRRLKGRRQLLLHVSKTRSEPGEWRTSSKREGLARVDQQEGCQH